VSGIPRFPAYLFDLDGTLMDSAADICGAIRQVLSGTPQRPQVEEEFLRRYIGLHLIDLFQDLGFRPEQIDPMIVEYRRIYPARGHSCTRVFPGVPEALSALPGKKSTATTKGTPSTRSILEQFGLLPFFDHVQGTDGFPAKPEPDVIFAALKGLGAEPSECLFVGDSPADMQAGKRAGVKTCAVRYGYGKAVALMHEQPEDWVVVLRVLSL
jgi:HAD superfamily hydrolase (TIGR01549 family)